MTNKYSLTSGDVTGEPGNVTGEIASTSGNNAPLESTSTPGNSAPGERTAGETIVGALQTPFNAMYAVGHAPIGVTKALLYTLSALGKKGEKAVYKTASKIFDTFTIPFLTERNWQDVWGKGTRGFTKGEYDEIWGRFAQDVHINFKRIGRGVGIGKKESNKIIPINNARDTTEQHAVPINNTHYTAKIA